MRMPGGWSPLETETVAVEVVAAGMKAEAEAGRPRTVLSPPCYRRRLLALARVLALALVQASGQALELAWGRALGPASVPGSLALLLRSPRRPPGLPP